MSESQRYWIDRRKGPDKGKWNLDEAELKEWLANGKLLPMDTVYDAHDNTAQYAKYVSPETFAQVKVKDEDNESAKTDIPEYGGWHRDKDAQRLANLESDTESNTEAKPWSECSRNEKILRVTVYFVLGGLCIWVIGYTIHDPSYLTDAFNSAVGNISRMYDDYVLVQVLLWALLAIILLLILMGVLLGVLWLFTRPILGPILWLIIGIVILSGAYNKVGGWITAALGLAMWAIASASDSKRANSRLAKEIANITDSMESMEERVLELEDRLPETTSYEADDY